MFSIAIPTYNSSSWIRFNISNFDFDGEIVIQDDGSKDFDRLERIVEVSKNNIKLYRNDKNIGAFHNKAKAVERCTSDWVFLLDSDNIINNGTIKALKEMEKKKGTFYNGRFAGIFDFKSYLGERSLEWFKERIEDVNVRYLFNEGNYLVNRQDYLDAYANRGEYDPRGCDPAYMNLLHIKNGGKMEVAKFEYFHTPRPDSRYMREYKANEEKIKLLITT